MEIKLTEQLVTRVVLAVLAVYTPTAEYLTAGDREENCDAVQDLRADIVEVLAIAPGSGEQNARFRERARAEVDDPNC